MSRMSLLSSPLLLGFEEMERLIDRVGKGGDGYPPYNIERIAANGAAANGARSRPIGCALRWRLPASGATSWRSRSRTTSSSFAAGRRTTRRAQFIHRGIAARQFSRSFVLAEGIEVKSADLSDGLLCIDLVRREPERLVRKVEIGADEAVSRSGHSARDRIAGR